MRKDIDFYTGLKEIKVKPPVSPAVIVLSILILLSSVVLALGFNGINILNQVVYNEAEAVHRYLTNADNQAVAQDTLKKQAIEGLYSQYAGITGKAYGDYLTLPYLDSAAYKKITAAMPADMKFLSYTATNGSIEISCECKKETSPADFVNALKKTDLFVEVIYNGYSVNDEGKVIFIITCRQTPGK
ncbi:hypothetical protein [Acetanaerobacterium elongatum]|uniref:Tfp pilus assembly protein PilN n=1 Tax=Acetanaerobacterium elongatum TaxID=258515 RepID=A0A1G9V4J8_9FIRM|nr:hypothetical protein [Acetanaerobacterium elongatum]SDM67013.1 hypothetical protein SAMN05192585_10349 [Acetanaerobacterium elongatum]